MLRKVKNAVDAPWIPTKFLQCHAAPSKMRVANAHSLAIQIAPYSTYGFGEMSATA